MYKNNILIENTDRKRVLLATNYFLVVSNSILSYMNIKVSGYYVLASIQVLVLLISLCIIFSIKRDRFRPWHSLITSLLYLVSVVYATYISDLNSGIAVWGMTLPVLFYFINSFRPGFAFSMIYFFIYIWILASVYNIDHTQNTKPFVNFVLAYIIVWVIAHVYETNRIYNQTQLTVLALKDSLTNANNLLALKHNFQQKTNNDQGVGLAMLDIDFFKTINDTYGHDVGDNVLVQLVALFQQKMAEENVYRTGGEEFVLLFDSNADEALKVLEDIRAATERKIFNCPGDNNVAVTFSCGFVHATHKMLKEPLYLSKMLKKADECLYSAKAQGRNKIITANMACLPKKA